MVKHQLSVRHRTIGARLLRKAFVTEKLFAAVFSVLIRLVSICVITHSVSFNHKTFLSRKLLWLLIGCVNKVHQSYTRSSINSKANHDIIGPIKLQYFSSDE